jgi:signal peptidase I
MASISQSPWIMVWFSPRQTIDRVLGSRLRYLVLPLACLGTISFFLGRFLSSGWVYQFIEWHVLLFEIVTSTVVGIVALYLNSFVFGWLGQSLGGCASPRELRVAWAWSALPGISGFLVVVILLVISRFFDHVSLFVPSGLLISVKTILAIFNNWSLVVFLVMISQVHRLALRWAIVTYALGLASIISFAFLVRVFLGYLFDIPPDLFDIPTYLKLYSI